MNNLVYLSSACPTMKVKAAVHAPYATYFILTKSLWIVKDHQNDCCQSINSIVTSVTRLVKSK